jgi:plasmid stability protein
LTLSAYHDYLIAVKHVLLRKVPDELHKKVKAAAARAGKSMQDFILDAMVAAVKRKPGK